MERGRQRLSKEELARRKAQLQKIKEFNEAAKTKALFDKSRIFYKSPGVYLKIMCVISIVFSVIYIYDTYSDIENTEFTVFDAQSETIKLVGGGDYIASTWYHVKLNEANTFEVLMYLREYEVLEDSGRIEIGHTSIFHKPYFFKVSNSEKSYIKPLGYSFMYTVLYPYTLLFICLAWLLMKPEQSIPIMLYGYSLMVITPFLLFLMVYHGYSEYNFEGFYSMPINSIQFKS